MRNVFVLCLLAPLAFGQASSRRQGVVLDCSFDHTPATNLQLAARVGVARAGAVPTSSGFRLQVTNAVLTTNGFIGNAYRFDGNGMVKVMGFGQPKTDEISYSVWINPSVPLNGKTRRNITAHCWSAHELLYEKGGLVLELYDDRHMAYRYRHDCAFGTNEWHHIGFTARGGHQVRMFVNGERVPVNLAHITNPYTGRDVPLRPEDPAIGSDKAPPDIDEQEDPERHYLHVGAEGYNRWYFKGVIDELLIWNRELPPGQMKQLYIDQLGESKRQKGK